MTPWGGHWDAARKVKKEIRLDSPRTVGLCGVMRSAPTHDLRVFRAVPFALSMIWGGCGETSPPGQVSTDLVALSITVEESAKTAGGKEHQGRLGEHADTLLGSPEDNLPFEPHGEKLASIAWRTWIYTDTGPRRTRLGYLRVGEVMDARGPLVQNDGCQGGWLRINPRGFVCLGKGATQDLEHPVLLQSSVRPRRGEGFPYRYVQSRERPPERYFRLPTPAQMIEIEGGDVIDRAAHWQARAQAQGLVEELNLNQELPPVFEADRSASLIKPYGLPFHLRRQVHSGRAPVDAGFALLDAFLWEGRGFGLTTEMDLLPLDRVHLVEEASLVGLALSEDATLPVAFHVKGAITLWKRNEGGAMIPAGTAVEQRGFYLTGKRASGGMIEAKDDIWLVSASVRTIQARDGFPSIATGRRKWIDISVKNQSLVAYEGRTPVYATLVSAGRGGLGKKGESNPDGSRTVRGTFMIHEKSVSSRMDGDEDRADSYELQDVPFVQYFHRGFALHGAYWHNEFGKERSHGCINLAPRDSAWLFEWTDPQVPSGWHAALNKERGTVVYVGY